MDKETLSNYGWIVIAVLVLVVMIALATPFGSFVSQAVQNTTKGLFDVNKTALDAAGVPGLTVQDQEFDVPDMKHQETAINTITINGTEYQYEDGMTWGEWVGSKYNTSGIKVQGAYIRTADNNYVVTQGYIITQNISSKDEITLDMISESRHVTVGADDKIFSIRYATFINSFPVFGDKIPSWLEDAKNDDYVIVIADNTTYIVR